MVGGTRAPHAAVLAVLALLFGLLLAAPARAQGSAELEAEGSALGNALIQLQKAGRYSEAIEKAEQLLANREKAVGPDHPHIAVVLNSLGMLYRLQGRYSEAEAIFKRTLAIREKALGPEHPDVASVLNLTAMLYSDQGRYPEAEATYKRALAIREKALGPDHDLVGSTLNNLATLYDSQGRYAEAEGLFKRGLALLEKAHGSEDPSIVPPLNNLAGIYKNQARYAEAEALYQRCLAIEEKAFGAEHHTVAETLSNLSTLYNLQGRYGEAEPLLLRSLAITEKVLGPQHPTVSVVLNNLGSIYKAQGRFQQAASALQRSMAIVESALGPDHPSVATAADNLATVYDAQGRYAEAEPLYRRALAAREKTLGPDHPSVGNSLINLGHLYHVQGRNDEAVGLISRSLNIREKALGLDHPDVAVALNNLATVYQGMGRFAEVERLLLRSLAIHEKVMGLDHLDTANVLNNLGSLYHTQSRYAEAEPLYQRSLAIREKALGPDHPDVAISLGNLAVINFSLGRYAEANALELRTLAIREKALGSDHPDIAKTLGNIAVTAYVQDDWTKAVEYFRRSARIFAHRAERGLTGARGDTSTGEVLQNAEQYWLFLKAAYHLAGDRPTAGLLAAETFEAAQWARASQAAASLTQMAARSATGSPQLAGLVRERQDLVAEWQLKDKLLIAARSEAPDKRKADAEKVLADRLSAVDARLTEIDRRLAQDFPDYAELVRATPLSIAETQAQLGADEAVVLFFDTPEWKPLLRDPDAYRDVEATFIWVVTKSGVRWVRSDLGRAALKRDVRALRCGLDQVAWEGAGAESCAAALEIPVSAAPAPGVPLPFDTARALGLYQALFGQVADLIAGKHLLVVPSGPLTQLPLQVLVTEPTGASPPGVVPPSGEAPTAWLARSHALTVLPAVSSLKALRRVSRPSAARRPMIGFGNPLLDGPDVRYAQLAALARSKQACAAPRRGGVAGIWTRSGVASVATRAGRADPSDLRMQVPLPETADELCEVASFVKADPRDIHLGAQATEREIKRLSQSGALASYRLLHFATHGALAGELDGTHEPGLLLTPPSEASEEDDGYLSASEIAALKLDAEWVILSACNTAAGAAADAEALSGLARAFIYAQARALLVSHWAVDSTAAVKLVTGAAREMARDAKVGGAEALRRAMLKLVDSGSPAETRPAYWAPFVVVGEGAARGR